MSIPVVSYEDFTTSNQGVVQNGGPWVVQSDFSTNGDNTTGCAAESTSWCEGYCLTCHVEPLNTPPTYYGSFITNISVNLANYGGATSLDFSWNYWPAYCGGATTQGAGIPVTSQIGDATFEEQFPALSFDAFFHSTTGGHQWDIADKISHNGSTSVVRGSDPNLGYITLKINATMAYDAANREEYLYFYVKAIGFLITTPILSATAAASPSSTSSVSAGVVAGAVVGALAFIALLVLAICLFRRRRKKTVLSTGLFPFTEQVNHEAPTPMKEGLFTPNSPSHFVTSYSDQPTGSASLHLSHGSNDPPQPISSASFRPPSAFARGSYDPPKPISSAQPTSSASLYPPSVFLHSSNDPPQPTHSSAQPTSSTSLRPPLPPSVFSDGSSQYDPPPIYRPDESNIQDETRTRLIPSSPSSPELARFAAANRVVINENLEARLQAAGYLPTEDPNRLTVDEWRDEYGVTKLELIRLQNLYARTQRVRPQ